MPSPPTIPAPSREALALLEGVVSTLFPEFDYKRNRHGLRSRTHKALALLMDDLTSGQSYIQQTGPGEYIVYSFPTQDHYYKVNLSATSGHEHTCGCWDVAGKGLCYHIIAVAVKQTLCLLAQQPGLFALAQPVATQPTTRSRKKSKPALTPKAVPARVPAPPAGPPPKPSTIPTLGAPAARRVTIPTTDDDIPF